MRDEAKTIGQQQIKAAAYKVLEDEGYAGSSMLAIARKARASNETLYSWYGDKAGLFNALVARNAAEVKALLEDRIEAGSDVMETLQSPSRYSLGFLPVLALSADQSDKLGLAISTQGRERAHHLWQVYSIRRAFRAICCLPI